MSWRDEIDALRLELEKHLSGLESIRQRLAQLAGEETPSVLEPPEWMLQRLEIWVKIYDAGGIVDQPTLHKFAKEAGYDTRGLAGFFKGRGSLVWIGKPGDGKVALSSWASEEVERYRDWLDRRKK